MNMIIIFPQYKKCERGPWVRGCYRSSKLFNFTYKYQENSIPGWSLNMVFLNGSDFREKIILQVKKTNDCLQKIPRALLGSAFLFLFCVNEISLLFTMRNESPVLFLAYGILKNIPCTYFLLFGPNPRKGEKFASFV